ncbi:aldo/keto reductase [Pseudoclavibacter chungangensis]|uniref:Aldo/keto reductase n=1 Tax=Pseudoclavibacter chungangensis TaxID=587635 RepID=A0A7J5C1U0_9MICO|nr:aldo/keto reductase [Pseudoclavibacter chungangensis]KAB1660060.1 aldo/keto reductase [Pseudoclavibacter chungangensis]NYJ66844.1 diketogulonate reductase-like aldo/keto reductase [Pseudoclavibacter chungangensis]
MTTIPTTTSHSGLTLPVLGFGTYKLNGATGVEAIGRALEKGYTLLDSAFNYENEGAVGRAARLSRRDHLVVTSKLPGRHHAYDEAIATVEESVYRTGLDAIDLYLIHWPNPEVDRYVEAWRALIDARERGLVRAIGVCNFLPEHLERLERETGVLPDVNQVELHPYFPQTEQLAFDRERGIITEAWSPLGRGNDLLAEPVIRQIASDVGATPGQVVLAWGIARGALPLPKAASDERQLENLGAVDVELNDDQIAAITGLGRADGRIADQDPAVYQEF